MYGPLRPFAAFRRGCKMCLFRRFILHLLPRPAGFFLFRTNLSYFSIRLAGRFICLWFGRRSPEHGFERGLTLFGYCTGTAASGLLLLRIVDPEFDTPVAVEVGLMNVFATILFKPISWSMPFVPVEGFPMLWIFVAVTVVTPIVMYFLKMIRKPAF